MTREAESQRGYGPDLARVHHAGFGGIARAAAQALMEELRAREHGHGTLVDLGCGSGILAARLTASGYDVLGVDASPDMVALARENAPRASFECASLHGVHLPAAVAVTAIGECLNYAWTPEETRGAEAALQRLVERVKATLLPGGIFLFDLAGPGRGGSTRTFFDGGEGCTCVESEEHEGLLTRHITSFVRHGPHYRRSDEKHVLRLHDPDRVQDLLERTGFECDAGESYGDRRLPPGCRVFRAWLE